jgi:hypothetical protein
MGALPARAPDEPTDEIVGAIDPLPLEDGVECLEPLEGLLRILID